MNAYRPWGHVDWILERLGGRDWSLIGCAGTESRSLALPLHLGRARLTYATMLAIRDPQPLDPKALDNRLEQHAGMLVNHGFDRAEILQTDLLSDLDEICGHLRRLTESGVRALLLDITSMPKYWFFPLLQSALQDERLEDLVITYTAGTGYAETLSENNGPLRALPGFFAEDGRTQHSSIVVGIGFEPFGLLPLLEEHVSERVRLIFPFPPGPPGHRRNWMFVRQIDSLTQAENLDAPDRVHIHMYDAPQVFEALCDMTNDGRDTSALAPYGPKTVSLTMCLFALAAQHAKRPRVPVLYAQPFRYNLDYTTGTAHLGDKPDTTAYCVRLRGRNLYDVP